MTEVHYEFVPQDNITVQELASIVAMVMKAVALDLEAPAQFVLPLGSVEEFESQMGDTLQHFLKTEY